MTLATLIDAHADDAVALIDAEQVTTYEELRSLVGRTRAGLVAADLHPGDRVAVVCTNTRSSAVSVLATTTAGMVAVLLEPSSPTSELRDQLDIVGAAHVLTGTSLDADLHDRISSPAGTDVLGVDPLPDGPDIAPVLVDPDQLAVMLFTSGTAGSPKAAMLSHGNLTSNQRAIIDTAGSGLSRSSVVLATIPISHMYGFNISLLSTLRAGGTVVLAQGFDPVTAAELISRHKVNRFAGVPPMWRAPSSTPMAFPTTPSRTSPASPPAPRRCIPACGTSSRSGSAWRSGKATA